MLNHVWQINHKSSLSSVVYASIGTGYGSSGQASTSSLRNYWYGSSNGNLNWNTYENNGVTYHFRHPNGPVSYTHLRAHETSV